MCYANEIYSWVPPSLCLNMCFHYMYYLTSFQVFLNTHYGIPSYHQSGFIGKKKSNYSLEGCKSLSYFAAAWDRKGMKRAWKSSEVHTGTPPHHPCFLAHTGRLEQCVKPDIIWLFRWCGMTASNPQEHSSRINKIINEGTLGEEWELVAALAALMCRNGKKGWW